MVRTVGSSGPKNANILIVGEAPGEDEEDQGVPFVGSSGKLLTQMLTEAGIDREACRLTNVCRIRPPKNKIDEFFLTKTRYKKEGGFEYNGKYINGPLRGGIAQLLDEVESCNPNLIIACGNTPLWALTGNWGIGKWRGSRLEYNGAKLIPIYHPAGVLRQWAWRFITVHDLRVAKREAEREHYDEPKYNFIIRPHHSDVHRVLTCLADRLVRGPVSIAVDIETRGRRHIACLGIAWNKTDALCIPFMCVEGDKNYWSLYEEHLIVCRLRYILTHPNARVIMQNGAYDCQYIVRWWGFLPRVWMDTMIGTRVLFPGAPADLSYISSLYCKFHRYWKDEGKEWESWMDEEQLWAYNCKDAVATWESAHVITRSAVKLGLEAPLREEMSNFFPVLRMMLRGVKIDVNRKNDLMFEMMHYISELEAWFHKLLGDVRFTKSKTAKPWYRSPQQLMTFFYDVVGLRPITRKDPKTGLYRRTVDDDALKLIARREPLLKPLCVRLAEYRTCNVLLSNVILRPLDGDERMRCSYSIGGAETFRFSSSEDAFGLGTNLQNITSGSEEE
jgi:uracil-DNA glycosylase